MDYVFDLACSGLTLVSSLLHWMWLGSEQMVLFYNTPVFSFHFSILCWHVRTWVPKNYSFSFQITFKRSKLTPQSLCMHFILFSWVLSMWVIKFIMVLVVFYLAEWENPSISWISCTKLKQYLYPFPDMKGPDPQVSASNYSKGACFLV